MYSADAPQRGLARTTDAYSLGIALFMSAGQRSHRVAYPQFEQANVFSQLSALQIASVLKHSMDVFGCNAWVGGHKVRGSTDIDRGTEVGEFTTGHIFAI
jgi:hypothetical protein